ncbi:MAG: hypothetical protein LBS55_03960 [Prevotellaceae bacterium]|nr:hypothetical protein [Prevotellaceae bacterium]
MFCAVTWPCYIKISHRSENLFLWQRYCFLWAQQYGKEPLRVLPVDKFSGITKVISDGSLMDVEVEGILILNFRLSRYKPSTIPKHYKYQYSAINYLSHIGGNCIRHTDKT